MINFEIPENIKNQAQMNKLVAEQAMRPYSRELDENEHARPEAFVNMVWPFVKAQMQGQVAKYQKAIDANGHNGSNGANGYSGTNGVAVKEATTVKKERKVDTSFLGVIMMIEQLSWGDAGQYLCLPHPNLGGSAVEAVGTLEQKVRIFGKWTDGEPKWGAMAITEPNAGSDNSSMRTTAVLDEETNEWILNGEKIFITNGKLSLEEGDGFCVVWATVDPSARRAGIKSFVVEANTPGVTIAKQEHKLGIKASDTVALSFVDARIPYDNILGSPEVRKKGSGTKGFKGAMKTFDASRPAVAASAIGIARASLEFTQQTSERAGR